MLDWFLNLVKTYPELIAIAGGLTAPIAITQMLYMWWYPESWSQRECFQVTSLVDFLICFLFTSNLWHYLDKDKDSHGLIIICSLGIACCAPLAHSVGLRFIMHRYPWLESQPKPGI